MAAIIIGVMLFFLFRFFTKSIINDNDKIQSFEIRISVTLIIGFIALFVLTAIINDPSKAGFIAFMISLGVYFGFRNNKKVTNPDIPIKNQVENPTNIDSHKESSKAVEYDNQMLINEKLNESTITTTIDDIAKIAKPTKISFLQKINIFKTLSRKDNVIIGILIIFSIVLAIMYLNKDYWMTIFVSKQKNEEVSKEREFKRTNYNAKIKFENNRLYFNIEIFNKSFYSRRYETNIDIIFVDVNGYSLEKVRIKANDLIDNSNTYYYKDNLQSKPEIFLKIHNVEITFTENRLNH